MRNPFCSRLAVGLILGTLAVAQSEPQNHAAGGAQTAAPAPSDFETKLDHGHFLVRRKGTLEWKPSSQFNGPIAVDVLDGDQKIYVPTEAVKPPQPIHREDPNYPISQLKHGSVSLHVVVDNHGVLRGPVVDEATGPEFAKAAMEAIKKWTFQPARLGEQPVAAVINVTMRFELF